MGDALGNGGGRTEGVVFMPRPGSHAYDVKRARLRKELESQGLSEQELETRVNKILHADPEMRPRKTGDRAEGPKGEREGG